MLSLFFSCQTVTYNGEITLKNKNFINLIINGNANLYDITVDGVATFSSNVVINNGILNALDSQAKVQCNHCQIKKLSASSLVTDNNAQITEATIKNNISINKTIIDNLIFSGTEAVFKDSKITSIQNIGYTNKRVIVLEDSEVLGNISFQSTEACKVLLKGNAKIHGTVTNGEVVIINP